MASSGSSSQLLKALHLFYGFTTSQLNFFSLVFLRLKSERYQPIWNPKFWIASTEQEIYTLVGKYTIIGVSKTLVKNGGGNQTSLKVIGAW